MTTLNDFYLAHGTPGLQALAQAVGTTEGFLRKMVYEAGSPGVRMARAIIQHGPAVVAALGGGKAPSAHGLLFPTNPPVSRRAQRQQQVQEIAEKTAELAPGEPILGCVSTAGFASMIGKTPHWIHKRHAQKTPGFPTPSKHLGGGLRGAKTWPLSQVLPYVAAHKAAGGGK